MQAERVSEALDDAQPHTTGLTVLDARDRALIDAGAAGKLLLRPTQFQPHGAQMHGEGRHPAEYARAGS